MIWEYMLDSAFRHADVMSLLPRDNAFKLGPFSAKSMRVIALESNAAFFVPRALFDDAGRPSPYCCFYYNY